MDGRVRSGRHKGDSLINVSPDDIELNTKQGDTNLCIKCKEFIPVVYKNGVRDRSNRIDCEDDGIISYHLECYRKEVFKKQ